mmetsp:Transcript_69426/g.103336  ORF Transcript_69426/g.103336 Transcript_69426/m.103336 type:complete len:917 (-) Transcript_69426:138-2888(-)
MISPPCYVPRRPYNISAIKPTKPLFVFFLATLLFLKESAPSNSFFVSATVSCIQNDPEFGDSLCVKKYRHGSFCTAKGICSNPFRSGCLRNVLPSRFTKLRTCNSDDDADASDRGECANSRFDYEEVRILSQNWESAMLSSWIMQIILSELLDVPSTLETSMPDTSFNFYDPDLQFSYSHISYDYDALRTARDNPDCETYQADQRKNGREYRSCAHVMPEAWNGQKEKIAYAEQEGVIEPTTGSGGVAKYSWYIPRFTAIRDPKLTSYFGMTAGSEIENRRLMADTFLRPKTWQYFCDEVSLDNCTTPYYDDQGRLIAERPPSDESEGVQYFLADFYHGHFAATEDNDCNANPFACNGHISNVQCDWSTFAIPQAHYLGIPVKGSGTGIAGGYPYARMVEIYNAANYTKSNVLFYWFTPDTTVQEFIGTDAEFQRVLLPPSTTKCTESRVTEEQRCSENPADRIGIEQGSCDAEAHSYQKLIVSSMYSNTYEVEESMRSPAYDAIKSIKISDLELEEIFLRWYERNTDRWNYDAREAVCMWVGEHIDSLQSVVPRSHPRSFRVEEYRHPALYGAIIVAAICIVLVGVVSVATFHYRKTKVIRYAQPIFLYLLLVGLLFLCIGATLLPAMPSQGTCIATQWFILLGYSLELVPLIVKVAALNTLHQHARKFKRVKLEFKNLYMTVGVIIAAVTIFLLIWTVMDPLSRQSNKKLTNDLNEDNGQIVAINYSCASDSPVWLACAYIYQLLLLVTSTVLAFQSRKVKQEFNESNSLVFVIYAHSVVLLLRIVLWLFRSSIQANYAMAITSYLLSMDIFLTLVIYFVPKLVAARVPRAEQKNSVNLGIYGATPILSAVEQIRLNVEQKTRLDSFGISVASNKTSMPSEGRGSGAIQQELIENLGATERLECSLKDPVMMND